MLFHVQNQWCVNLRDKSRLSIYVKLNYSGNNVHYIKSSSVYNWKPICSYNKIIFHPSIRNKPNCPGGFITWTVLFCVLCASFNISDSFCSVTRHYPNSHYSSILDGNYLSMRLMDLCSRWLLGGFETTCLVTEEADRVGRPSCKQVTSWLHGGIEAGFINEDLSQKSCACLCSSFSICTIEVSLKMSQQFINQEPPVLNVFLIESWPFFIVGLLIILQ